MRSNQSLFGVLGMVPLMGLLGCSGVLPATLQEKLATGGNAEDHLAAAMLYQNKARELEAEAVQYETTASKISPMTRRGLNMRASIRRATEAG